MTSTKKQRRESAFILRFWREPSDLSPPGELRGVLRSLDGSREMSFKSAQELWDHLTKQEKELDTTEPQNNLDGERIREEHEKK